MSTHTGAIPCEKRQLLTKLNEVQEFIEIAGDFANPLELVREAISNAFDAKAKKMSIGFTVEREAGEDILVIAIEDNGRGMNMDTIRSFFDLGNSSNRDNADAIGEKGHGTKVYFNSAQVRVETVSSCQKITATMDEPYKQLFSRKLPEVKFTQDDAPDEFKYFLTQTVNHSFKNLHSIICWDTEVKNGDIVTDVNGESRRMTIVSPNAKGEHTCYFLDNPKRTHKIEVFVLKDYLKEKLDVAFRPRPATNEYNR